MSIRLSQKKLFFCFAISLLFTLFQQVSYAQLSFQPVVYYGVGNGPTGSVTADFNKDGKLDVATADENSNNVSVLLGKGDGTFNNAVSYGVGNSPFGLIYNDFNGDGKLDLASENFDGTVSILLGNGDGTFSFAGNFSTVSGSLGLAAADFNKDGKQDIVVSDQLNSDILVLLSNGNGTFGSPTTIPVGGTNFDVTTGDFNGDGKPDIASANQDANTVSVLLGKGDGTFGNAVNYATGSGPTDVVTADVNGDGKTDLVSGNYYGGNVSVLLGNGDGTFKPAATFGVGVRYAVYGVTVADFDGDGKQDIASTNGLDNSISVLKGNGDGTFNSPVLFATGQNPFAAPVSGDFNGDGKPDIANSNTSSNNISVLLNNSTPCTTISITTQPQNVVACAGSTVTFSVTATGTNLTYKWTKDGTTLSTTTSTLTINNVQSSDAGTYTVDVIGNCSTVTSREATLTVTPKTEIITQPQNTAVCKGSTATFTVAAGGSNLIYKWYKNGQSARSSNNSTTLTLDDVQPSDAGKYTVDVIGDCGTVTSDTAVLTVTVAETPIVTVSNSCRSSTLSTTATGSLLWSTNETTSSITVTTAGKYTVTQTVNGCTSAEGSGTAAPYPVLNTPTITSQTNVSCNGNNNGSVSIAGSGGTTPYTYSTDGMDFSNTSGTFGSLVADGYTITVKDAHGCTATVLVTISQPLALTALVNVGTIGCHGGSTTVTITPSGGTAPYTNGGIHNVTAGPYSFTVTDAHSCSYLVSGTITEPSAIGILISKTDPTCSGQKGSITVKASGGTGAYQYKINTAGSYQATNTFSNLAPGDYTITVKDAKGCTASINVNINSSSSITATLCGPQIICYGSTTIIVTTVKGGKAKYQYKLINAISGATIVNYQSSLLFLVKAGSYKVMVKDAGGCEATSNTLVISQPPVLKATITSQTNVSCKGGSDGKVTVTASGGKSPYEYKINTCSSYQSTGTFTKLRAGCYTVIVKDANGCVTVVNVAITQPSKACPAAKQSYATVMNQDEAEDIGAATDEPDIKVFPNPTTNYFTLVTKGKNEKPVEVRVLDIYGRNVYNTKGSANETFRFGDHFTGGTYLVQVIQGETIKTMKVIKGN